ncbi:MAG: flagellar basal body rod protein FlgC [Phycisphaerales bacterium]|nr:flagellar basal body rod protein FlgC [Phycisphaerales bacterium]MCB9840360.1 flagellar basal body rod protein FlgC [Phycisphaeraceae bacterium]
MYGTLDISTSGLIAQRTRLEAISANIANSRVILDADGNLNPYKRREVFFAPGDPSAATPAGRALGVHVAAIEANEDAVRFEPDPSNPFADERGMVPYPDIDPVMEQVSAMEAIRAYEANITVAEATKSMMAQALRLIA